jgi:hypothetical protein
VVVERASHQRRTEVAQVLAILQLDARNRATSCEPRWISIAEAWEELFRDVLARRTRSGSQLGEEARTLQTGRVESRQKFCARNKGQLSNPAHVYKKVTGSIERTWKFPNCVEPMVSGRVDAGGRGEERERSATRTRRESQAGGR